MSDFLATAAGALEIGHLNLLVFALLLAFAFEFINGFHDTANAVATVIYTRSLKPGVAVVLSGIFNFLGVIVGGTAVAMGIIKLLPAEIVASNDMASSLAMVLALLVSAIVWNLGTWYLGLPASSSHTLIGSILGIGIGQAIITDKPLSAAVNWSKAQDIGLALVISPLFGFALAAALLAIAKFAVKSPRFHASPTGTGTPPWPVRALLVGTSSGVSFAHGSNDGQKGIGLVMLVLLAVLPGHFALSPAATNAQLQSATLGLQNLSIALTSGDSLRVAQAAPATFSQRFKTRLAAAPLAVASAPSDARHFGEIVRLASSAMARLEGRASVAEIPADQRFALRTELLALDSRLASLEKSRLIPLSVEQKAAARESRAGIRSLTEHAPLWVIVMIAVALGVGTMVGWKRIVVTVGEKIGKSHLTYSQGAAAELVAMSTIWASASLGLPVSTTHVLSSGVAGTMVAGKSGIQGKTVRNIALAWLLTLPVTMTLSSALYVAFRALV